MDLLAASVQNYGWGDPAFIPELQQRTPTGAPEAELWMGAHPKAPSRMRSAGIGLDEHIATDLTGALGSAASFGQLPFLKKVLAAAQPLSIQTHPNLEQARIGFARENEEGVPLDSPTRTYRDANHKPELICALTPFDAKCGFRSVEQSRDLVSRLDNPGVAPLAERLAAEGDDAAVLADVLQWLLTLDNDAAARLTGAVVDAATSVADGPWLTEIMWTHRLQALYPGDPGVIVALLLNHFTLEPGEALFLEAGVLHAYVQGAGIEIMANSDNVIRGGLTPKHIDVTELAAIVDTTPIDPPVQKPASQAHTFDSPVDEFALTRLVIDDGYQASSDGPEILIATSGAFRLSCGDAAFGVEPGSPVWIDASDGPWTAEGHGTLFRATVPSAA